MKYKDFAILYRNNALSRVIEDRLVKNSIPYRLLGGVPFYSRKEIKDIMCYLKILYNPADDVSLKRIINVPKRGIGNTTIDKISNYSNENGISFYETLHNIENIPELKSRVKKLSDFNSLISDLQEDAAKENISDLIEIIISKTGYKEELENEATEEALGRIENLNELISKAAEFEEMSENVTLSSFLEEVALVAEIDNYSEEDDSVVLMTVHSSKGLEFPVVFIAGFEDGIFPSYRSIIDTNPFAVEEERRLCYVGITRAKTKLYLTCAKSRMQHGDYIFNSSSRFIKEIPDEFIDNNIQNNTVKRNSQNKIQKVISNTQTEKKRTIVKNYTSYSSILSPKEIKLDFNVGDKVKQFKYGIGIVKEIIPAGADYEITVEFPEAGTKKFMAMLSKLKKL